MSLKPWAFSPDQWRFLAALEACGEPVAPDLAKTMTAIKPAALEALLTQGQRLGWIQRTETNLLALAADLPDSIRSELQRWNSSEHLSAMIRRIRTNGLEPEPATRVLVKLLTDTGQLGEAAEVELDLAHELLGRRDHDRAYHHLSLSVEKLYRHIFNGASDKDRLFVEAVIELSSLSFAVGRKMQVLLTYLRTAVKLTKASGNVRSHALACLHLGRLLAYLDQPGEGLAMLATGKSEVELLGDADILKAAAEFLGLYFVLQGLYREAIIHFERAEQLFTQEQDSLLVYPMILWALGITLFTTGQVPRALGLFQSYWRSAKDMGLPAVASIARALLGFSLAVARKRPEALFHLQASLKEAGESRYTYALFIARAGLAIQYFQDGDLKTSYEVLRSAVAEGHKWKSTLLYVNEYLLDMLAAFHHHKFEPISEGWEYEQVLDLSLQEPSIVQRGIALRRRAEDSLQAGRDTAWIMKDLNASLAHLEQAGAALALNDTLIALARLHLREGAPQAAQALLQKVWHQLRKMGLERDYLPDDLNDMLPGEDSHPVAGDYVQSLIDHYLKLLHELDAAVDEDELFHGAVWRIGRLLRAERGALFWSFGDGAQPQFGLRAGYNFKKREIYSDAFKPSLELIGKSLKDNQYIRTRPKSLQPVPRDAEIRELLCIPIEVAGAVKGVLYYDDCYLSADFGSLPAQWTPMLIQHTNIYIGHILELLHGREKIHRLTADKSIQLERFGRGPILTRAPVMLKMLDQAEKAARSEATLLVTGETGTGKELLVSRLHKFSPRSAGPLAIVDSTVIPESLVESELFGHEKGAFTGADTRKPGRIELAHQGTLFIDEIGELPLQVQGKLLRALETKTFYRVGGTRSVKSDFRLVAATNRNLADEVAAGRFRQDLYYRLNVIQLVLPPLKERGDDVVLLARHFLRHYGKKYGRPGVELTRSDQDKLMAYSWPGNVRQLKNVIERAIILSTGKRLILDLPSEPAVARNDSFADTPTLDEMQRRYIAYILGKTGGRIYGPNGAAKILGMKRSTLYKRMDKLGIRKNDD